MLGEAKMNGRVSKWVKVRSIGALLLVSIGTFAYKVYQPVAAKVVSIEVQPVQGAILNDPQPVAALDSQVDAELLQWTVQIRLYTSLPVSEPADGQPDSNVRSYHLASGLGSLVVWQGRNVIVTHNHWGDALSEAEHVQIHDAYGNLLIKLGIDQLKDLILYSDHGTLVLYNPIGLGISASSLEEAQSVDVGDFVTIAHQDPDHPGQVDLLQAKVVNHCQNEGLSVLQVAAVDNETIVSGDSGGGVWSEGELVGNTWAMVVEGDQADSSDVGLVAPLPGISLQIQNDGVDNPIAPIVDASEFILG